MAVACGEGEGGVAAGGIVMRLSGCAGWLRPETFAWEALVSDAGGVAYAPGRLRATRVVCCEGAAAVRNPYFGWLPLTPNQGEVLDVECANLSAAQVLIPAGVCLLLTAAGVWYVARRLREAAVR